MSVNDLELTWHHEEDGTGDAQMSAYSVFPGIKILYHAMHTKACTITVKNAEHVQSRQVIEIHHCREGRMEQELGNEFVYLMPGDLSVTIRREPTQVYNFPIHHYHGITILIDTEIAPKCFSCILKDVNVEPMQVAERLCRDKTCFVIRSKDYIKHIFSELYAVPDEIRLGYCKIKIMELLLFLSVLEIDRDESASHTVSPAQVILAKHISAYLTERMDERVTVKQVSEQFHMSEANIKTVFKAVYGVPVYAFVRTQKMESAAYMLEYTDQSILEIAGRHGYDNASKFASAFRDIKGVSPTEFRALHRGKPAEPPIVS